MPSANPSAISLNQDTKVISLISIAHSISHFFQLLLPPLFPWLKDAFNLSYAELGFLMTIFFVVSGIGQALAGFVVDRIGPRAVLFFGLACMGVAALLLAAAPGYSTLLAGSILAGVGNSVFHPCDFTLLNKRISAPRLGHAFSIHGITGSLGWAAAPMTLATIAGLASWRTALFAAAFLPFAVLLLLALNRDLLQIDEGKAGPATLKKKEEASGGTLFGFMRMPAIWMCFAFFFIIAMASGGIQSFSIAGLRNLYGMSLVWATAGYTGYMLGSAGGMVLGGFLATRTTRHERIFACGFVIAGAMALVIGSGIPAPWLAVALMVVVGIGSGIAGPSRDLLIRASAPGNATGRVYGVVYSAFDIGLSVAPLLFAALMDADHPAWVFICIGIFQVMAILTAIGVGTNTARKSAMQPA